jgi:dTDP-glucose 4,6-dehydratase
LRPSFPESPRVGGSIPSLAIENQRLTRKAYDRRYAIDSTNVQRELGWTPAETFETGIRKTIRWYLDHMVWVESVTSGAYRDWIGTNYAAR